MKPDFITVLERSSKKGFTADGRDRSKIGKSAKRKGKTGERYVAEMLSKYSGLPFRRIPNSGGLIGSSNRNKIFECTEDQSEGLLGDIFPPMILKKRIIAEVKNYKDFAWNKLEKGEVPAKLKGWINENLFDIETYYLAEYKRNPIGFLVFKITNEGSWIVYNTQYFENVLAVKTKPLHTIQQSVSDLLHSKGYGDLFYVEEFENFVKINKDILFEKRSSEEIAQQILESTMKQFGDIK
jgi:hypothetical protein